MAVLDRTALLNAMKLKTETVKIDGGEVIITEVTASEYMEIYNSEAVKDSKGEFDGTKFSSLLAVRSIVDKKGKRLFEDADADLLVKGSATVYTRIAVAVKRLNGLAAEGKN